MTVKLISVGKGKDAGTYYKEAFDKCNDAIFIIDSQKNIFDVNGAALEFFGYTKREMLGMTVKDLHPRSEHLRSSRGFKEVLRKGRTRFDTEFIRKDGSIFKAQVSANTFTFKGKTAVQGVVRDTTQLYYAEKALRRSEAKMRALLDSMIDLVFELDDQKRIVFYHAPERSLLYTSPKIFMNKKIKEVMPRSVSEMVDEGFEMNRKGRTMRFRYCLPMKRRLLWFSANMSPVVQEGRFSGSSVVIREITDQKRIEDEKLQKYEELANMDRFKSSIMRDVAHELKTPLSLIIFSLDNCLQNAKDAAPDMKKLRRYLSIAVRNAQMSKRETDMILQFSRLESIESLKKMSINLKVPFKAAIEEMRPFADEKGLSINLVSPKNCWIKGNAAQLEALMRNLLENAIKFSKRGEITVWCKEDKSSMSVAVTDQGCGMGKREMEGLFKPYYKGKKKYPGLGLGLSIVKKIADFHGAKISVESRVNRGSTFMITFKR